MIRGNENLVRANWFLRCVQLGPCCWFALDVSGLFLAAFSGIGHKQWTLGSSPPCHMANAHARSGVDLARFADEVGR